MAVPTNHTKAPPGAHHPPHAAKHTYLKGVDVHHGDGHVNWSKVKAAGVSFAFAKATEGKTYTDPRFSANWADMKAAGLVRGAYHYARPEKDAVAQAQRFYDVVQPTHGDLPLVLDLEKSFGKKPADVWQWAQDFLAKIESLTGQPAIFYSYGYYWHDDMGNPTDNLDCPLWLADYRSHPQVPKAWKTWTFWQYTGKGTVAGVDHRVDRNYFQGTLSQLNALTSP
jgi:lysozyme